MLLNMMRKIVVGMLESTYKYKYLENRRKENLDLNDV